MGVDVPHAERTHHQHRRVEQHGLEHHGEANGQAEPENFGQLLRMHAVEAAEDAVFAQGGREPHHRQHGEESEGVGAGAGDAGAEDAEARRAEMAEDQRVIGHRIEADAQQHDVERRLRPRQRGREIAQHLVAERKGQAEAQHTGEQARTARELRRLAEGEHDRPHEKEQHDQGHRGDQHRPEAHAHHRPHAGAIVRTGAQDVRDHRRHRCHRAAADQPAEEKGGVAECRRRQRGSAVVAEHDDIGRHDGHLRQLGDHQRRGELHQLARFRDPGVEPVAGDARAGLGEIEFCDVCHDTGFIFMPEPGCGFGDRIQKSPPKRSGLGRGETFERTRRI